MKYSYALKNSTILIFALILSFSSFATENKIIEVSFSKTIHLVFDSDVKYVECGSQDVLFQKKDKLVELKAAIDNFEETNILIETEKGEYYTFSLVYNNDPDKYFYHITRKDADFILGSTEEVDSTQIIVEKKKVEAEKKEKSEYELYSNKVLAKKNTITDQGVSNKRTKFFLDGIYVHENNMYFKITVVNNSNINYDIDFIRFVKRSSKGISKKTAVHEEQIYETFVKNGDIKVIKGKGKVTVVFVFNKFTIDNDKKVFVELWEAGGERELEFNLPSKVIMNAKPI